MKIQLHSEEQLSFGRQVALFIWELVKVIVISLVIIVPIRYFLIKPFYVKGASMEPNYFNKQYLIIDEISYRLATPSRGDVVVFKYPLDQRQYFIKRVIGLPTERVTIADGEIKIYNTINPNGKIVAEPYIPAGVQTLGQVDVTLTAEQYFLLGDNRMASLDSRVFGPVQRQLIIGRTLLRGWPLDQFGLLTNNLHYNL